MRKWLDWPALLAYCGMIFWLSAQERLPMPDVIHFQDKVLHFGAYFVMAVFSWRAFRHALPSLPALAWTSFLFCSVYGMSDEWHQSFVPGRSVSAFDWLADSIGAALSAYLMLRFDLMRLDKAMAHPSR